MNFQTFVEKIVFSKNFLVRNHTDFGMVSRPEKMFFRHKQVHGIFYGVFEFCAFYALDARALYCIIRLIRLYAL